MLSLRPKAMQDGLHCRQAAYPLYCVQELIWAVVLLQFKPRAPGPHLTFKQLGKLGPQFACHTAAVQKSMLTCWLSGAAKSDLFKTSKLNLLRKILSNAGLTDEKGMRASLTSNMKSTTLTRSCIARRSTLRQARQRLTLHR